MKWLIEIFDKFLRHIHYLHAYKYYWVGQFDEDQESYQEYQRHYREKFGDKPDFEPVGDGWNAIYRELWRCEKCLKVVADEKVAYI